MKISINDESGSSLIAVLKLDGSPAVEGTDYIPWEGKFHENGKWSYREGGVALKEGIVVFNQNHLKRAYIVKDNTCPSYAPVIMGRFDETPQKPEDSHGFFGYAFPKVLRSIIEWGYKRNPEGVDMTLISWEAMEKFL